MDDVSIFMEQSPEPTTEVLAQRLGPNYSRWKRIQDYVLHIYPKGKSEWFFSGAKWGWNFRIKDTKRAILYFLPREGYFKVSFIFGDKAVEKILERPVSDRIKTDLSEARKYAEGRGVQIAVNDDTWLPDIEQLIDVKLNR